MERALGSGETALSLQPANSRTAAQTLTKTGNSFFAQVFARITAPSRYRETRNSNARGRRAASAEASKCEIVTRYRNAQRHAQSRARLSPHIGRTSAAWCTRPRRPSAMRGSGPCSRNGKCPRFSCPDCRAGHSFRPQHPAMRRPDPFGGIAACGKPSTVHSFWSLRRLPPHALSVPRPHDRSRDAYSHRNTPTPSVQAHL